MEDFDGSKFTYRCWSRRQILLLRCLKR
jgi:hypothetical protein